MKNYAFPKTWLGWKRLFWLTLHRCPIHHSVMNLDWPPYDDGTRYCLKCEGVSMWPGGLLSALWQNAQANRTYET